MTVYVHQIHALHNRTSVDPLFEAVGNDYLPLLGELDVRLVGYWRVSTLQGRAPEAVAVWELDSYTHLQRFNRALHGSDRDGRQLRAWHEREGTWIASTEGLICEPATSSPTVAQLVRDDVHAAMCCHEYVTCKPHRHIEYPERLTEMWANRFSANPDNPKARSTVGLYYAKWTNTVAINIWGTGAEWDDVVIWDPAWEEDASFDLWNTLGREIRDDFTDRFLLPAPFSTVR